MIKMTAIGHLGKDASIGNANGKPVINFNVAHTDKYKDVQGVEQSKTTWIECAWWTEKHGIVPYLGKGTQVYVEGIPEVSSYVKDGVTIPTLKLRVLSMQLCGEAKPNAAAAPAAAPPPGAPVWNGTAWVTPAPAPAPVAAPAPTAPVWDAATGTWKTPTPAPVAGPTAPPPAPVWNGSAWVTPGAKPADDLPF